MYLENVLRLKHFVYGYGVCLVCAKMIGTGFHLLMYKLVKAFFVLNVCLVSTKIKIYKLFIRSFT